MRGVIPAGIYIYALLTREGITLSYTCMLH